MNERYGFHMMNLHHGVTGLKLSGAKIVASLTDDRGRAFDIELAEMEPGNYRCLIPSKFRGTEGKIYDVTLDLNGEEGGVAWKLTPLARTGAGH